METFFPRLLWGGRNGQEARGMVVFMKAQQLIRAAAVDNTSVTVPQSCFANKMDLAGWSYNSTPPSRFKKILEYKKLRQMLLEG